MAKAYPPARISEEDEIEGSVKKILTRIHGYLLSNLPVDGEFIRELRKRCLLSESDSERLREIVEEGRSEDAVYRLLHYMTSYYDMKMLKEFCDFLVEFQAPTAAERIRKEIEKHCHKVMREESSVKMVLGSLRHYLHRYLYVDRDFISRLLSVGLLSDIDAKSLKYSVETQGDTEASKLLLEYMEWCYDDEMLEKFCSFLDDNAKLVKPILAVISRKIREEMAKCCPPTSQFAKFGIDVPSKGLPEGKDPQSSPVAIGNYPPLPVTYTTSGKAKAIVDMYRSGKTEVSLPINPDLEDKFDKIVAKLYSIVPPVDSRVIAELRGILRRKYRRYIHGTNPAPLPQIPDTASGLCDFIEENSSPYEIWLIVHAVEILGNKELKLALDEYAKDLSTYLTETLLSLKRRGVTLPQRKHHTHMAVVLSKEQVLFSLVLHLKEYFIKYLQLTESIFEGFQEGCIILFFSILNEDAALLAPNVLTRSAELKKAFNMTHLIVFEYFICDFEKATIELFHDSRKLMCGFPKEQCFLPAKAGTIELIV